MATKGFAFGNHKLLKKLDQNFIFSANWVPRGKSQSHPLNQYVDWVQAQPAENFILESLSFMQCEA